MGHKIYYLLLYQYILVFQGIVLGARGRKYRTVSLLDVASSLLEMAAGFSSSSVSFHVKDCHEVQDYYG